MKRIPLSKPSITNVERDRVNQVMLSGRLALGPQIVEFEKRMAEAAGTDFAVAVNSGTAALHVILSASGIREYDEIITTPFSFVASANAALFCNAVPKFVDIDEDTLNLDVEAVPDAITERTRGIIGVDVFGLPADWIALEKIAAAHDLLLVDDSCEALGATLNGQKVGSFGDASAFGFYPNKQITTGEGGCVTTNSEPLVDTMRSLRNQGRSTSAVMHHVRLGYNYRMNELSAALGNAQLERLAEILDKRRYAAEFYSQLLAPFAEDVITPKNFDGFGRSWFVYVIQLEKKYSNVHRDQLMIGLREKGIECAPYFPCIHLQPFYEEQFGYRKGMFPVAESVADRSLALPFFPDITEQEISRVVDTMRQELTSLLSSSSREATHETTKPRSAATVAPAE